MKNRQYLIDNPEYTRNKTKGALCGLAIGDSMGDAGRTDELQKRYGISMGFSDAGAWSTDDTEFALLTAQALLQNQGCFESGHIVDLWLKYVVSEGHLKRGGLGSTEASWNLRRGLRPPVSGQFTAHGCSDGAAMRSAPIGIVCAGDPEKAAYLAETDASVSHSKDGIWGAQAVAVAVCMAMVDASIGEMMDQVWRVIPKDSWFAESMHRAEQVLKNAQYNVVDAWIPLHDQILCTYKSAVPEAITATFSIIQLEYSDFANGMMLGCNYGRDADTIGAVTGAILGARLGAEAIPESWMEQVRYPSGCCLSFTKGLDLFDVADRLAGLVQ